MSTPTTARGALLRRAGTLLVAAALVGAPATSAFADPTASPTLSPTADGEPHGIRRRRPPSPSASRDRRAHPDHQPVGHDAPSPTSPAPSPSASGRRRPAPRRPARRPRVLKALGLGLAQAASAATPQTAYAADFIARTLADGDDHYVYPDSGGFLDGGNTIDAILALRRRPAPARPRRTPRSPTSRTTSATTWAPTSVDLYAGPTAKALLAVRRPRGRPDRLRRPSTSSRAPGPRDDRGRFSDDSAYGDYSNTIGQSLGRFIATSRSAAGFDAASATSPPIGQSPTVASAAHPRR